MTQPLKPSLTIGITGATGLIGSRLSKTLTAQGHTVYPLRRGISGSKPAWDVASGEIITPWPLDILIHLAGRNVANRWTARVKKEIWDSRVPATEKLCEHLASLPPDRRPRLLITASAIGIYGNRGDEVLTEDSAPADIGQYFLADVCRAWEAATEPASDVGIPVVHVRVGVVLAKDGGALAKLATPTKFGLGGPVGPGTQFLPWISSTDLCRLLSHLAQSEPSALPPVINGVGPAPVRQHEFMRTLGKVLHRPVIFPMPSFMVKLLFGQMGEEALLSSLRVITARLPAGFAYEHATLEAAIRAELQK